MHSHTASFFAFSGDSIWATVGPLPAEAVPTVQQWRAALARTHFMAPSFRWVEIVDGADVLEDGDAELSAEEIQERELHAVLRRVPDITAVPGQSLEGATKEQKSDKMLCLRMIERDPSQYRHCSEELRTDLDLVEATLAGCGGDGWTLDLVQDVDSPAIRRLKIKFAKIAIASDPKCLIYPGVPDEVRDDPVVVRNAMQLYFQKNPTSTDARVFDLGASERLRNDRAFCEWATQLNPVNVVGVGPDLLRNREFALGTIRAWKIVVDASIQARGTHVWHFPREWWQTPPGVHIDLEVAAAIAVKMLSAIRQHLAVGAQGYVASVGLTLYDLSIAYPSQASCHFPFCKDTIFRRRLWNSVDFVEKAVREDGFCLRFAGQRLRQNPNIMEGLFEAATSDKSRFPCPVSLLQFWLGDIDFFTKEQAMEVVASHPLCYKVVVKRRRKRKQRNTALWNDHELARVAFTVAGESLRVFPPNSPWRWNKDFVIRAVSHDKNKDMVEFAQIPLPDTSSVKTNSFPPDVRAEIDAICIDRDVVRATLTVEPDLFDIWSSDIVQNDPELALLALGHRQPTARQACLEANTTSRPLPPGFSSAPPPGGLPPFLADDYFEHPENLDLIKSEMRHDPGVMRVVLRSFERRAKLSSEGDKTIPFGDFRRVFEVIEEKEAALVSIRASQSSTATVESSIEEELAVHRAIVLTGVQHYDFDGIGALAYLSSAFVGDRVNLKRFLDDYAIVLAGVSKVGLDLQHASPRLRGEAAVSEPRTTDTIDEPRQVVLAAVKRDGRALQFAAERFRGNREIVLAAIRAPGFSLQENPLDFASPDLVVDPVVKAAVREAAAGIKDN